MPQSLSKIYIHCIFSTKNRKPYILARIQNDLHAYMIGTLSKYGSYVLKINSPIDHVHILFTLPRTLSIAELISKAKSSSSKWAKTQGIPNFYWQDGYGCFSVSSSVVPIIEKYIQNQKAHHEKFNFKKEYLQILQEYDVDFNEEYMWD